MNPCTIPLPIDNSYGGTADDDDRWLSIHKRFLSECREKDPDVIFIGDCILESLQHTQTWNQYFAPLHSLNFSIYQDQIQNTLWRIQNGELEHVKPKIVVILIGTNNIRNTAEEIAEGIIECIKVVREKLNEVYIVIPSLLPRGHQPNKLREKHEQINSVVRELCISMKKVQTVQIDKGLIQPDGTISHHDMYDYLNLTNSGAHKVFEPVFDLLTQILNENEPEKDLTPSE